MPQTLAQFMGMLIAGIVVLGTDLDVIYSVPLGIMAGAITIYLASLAPPPGARARRVDPPPS